ncbi:MAG: hypothetical protein GY816_22790 [Cytophagales bacterium]|nr:hypothetical protein [Cytophagales bacterium]
MNITPPSSDFLFKYWTHLGDGFTVFAVFVILLFTKKRHGYVLGLLGLALAGVSALLKQIVFGKLGLQNTLKEKVGTPKILKKLKT